MMADHGEPSRPWTSGSLNPAAAGFFLVLVTAAALVPFADKAVHIDDPLFLWTARQIQAHPADFYGFPINWYGLDMSMARVMKNPPLAAYYIALVAALAGWTETALHLAFLVPAIAAALGTYCLARRLCARPVLATLAGILTPVFLVSSTSLMCDTLMLAFWVWAVVLWIRGLEPGGGPWLLASGCLIAACGLTKYYGVSLVPLLLVYSLVQRRGPGWWLLALVIPVVVLAAYQWATHRLYGRGLLLDAASFASTFRARSGASVVPKGFTELVFSGGCLVPVLFYAPLLWSRRVLAAGVLLGVLITVTLPWVQTISGFPLTDADGARWLLVVQLAIDAVSGISLLVLAAADFSDRRDAAALLLVLWIGGTFVFAGFINWVVNARSVLPMVPAAGILVMRRIERRAGRRAPGPAWRIAWPLVPAAVVALLCTWADYRWAGVARIAAAEIHRKYPDPSRPLWFLGHWGFQYYMEARGDRPIWIHLPPAAGDLVVVPSNNTQEVSLRPDRFRSIQVLQFPACSWLATMNPAVGAGFFADIRGPLPFAVGAVPPERYWIVVITR